MVSVKTFQLHPSYGPAIRVTIIKKCSFTVCVLLSLVARVIVFIKRQFLYAH